MISTECASEEVYNAVCLGVQNGSPDLASIRPGQAYSTGILGKT
jgi:hypothetical protein